MTELKIYRHVKRGTIYRVLGRAQVLTDRPLVDMEEVCIFRGVIENDMLVCSAKGMNYYSSNFVLRGRVQASIPLKYGYVVVVYQSEKDASLWVRTPTEFEDGRFEKIKDLT